MPPHITYSQYSQLLSAVNHTKGKLKDYYNARDTLILHLLWETGGRVGDIARLKVSDFNIQEKLLTMRVQKRKTVITIPLTDDLLLDYLNYLSQRNKRESHFAKNMLFDLSPTRLWQIVKAYGDKLHLQYIDSRGKQRHLHPHMFRHGLAIHLLEKGVPIPVISARLGHASTTTTMRFYLVITPEIQRQIITSDKLKD